MNYNGGTNYGYDEIQTSPLQNNFDNPYLEVPRILQDQQYASSAVRSSDIDHHTSRKMHMPVNAQQIAIKHTSENDEGMHSLTNINVKQNDMLLIFIYILIIIVAINSVTLKHLNKQIEHLQHKTIYMHQLATK
jgi:hypothetical protein